MALVIKELFNVSSVDPLPDHVLPLYDDNRCERFLDRMPASDRWGIIREGEAAAERPNPFAGQLCASDDSSDESKNAEELEDAAEEATSSRPEMAVPPPIGGKRGKVPAKEPTVVEGSKRRRPTKIIGLER